MPRANVRIPCGSSAEMIAALTLNKITCLEPNQKLERDDSAYLDSSKPHTFHGLGDNVAKMLAVASS